VSNVFYVAIIFFKKVNMFLVLFFLMKIGSSSWKLKPISFSTV